jgi:hypothetical protein
MSSDMKFEEFKRLIGNIILFNEMKKNDFQITMNAMCTKDIIIDQNIVQNSTGTSN